MSPGVEALPRCPGSFQEGYSGQQASLPPPPLVPAQEVHLLGHCEASLGAPGGQGPEGSQSHVLSGPSLQKKHLQQEKECLMSKLVEAEMDGAAAAKQVMALKDTIGKLKTVGGRQTTLALRLGPEMGKPHGRGPYAVIRLTL